MAKYHNIPVKPATWLRFRDYKMVSATSDEALNRLMDSLPLEVVTEEVLKQHRHRMATFKGRSLREIAEEFEGEAAKRTVRGRGRSSRRKSPS